MLLELIDGSSQTIFPTGIIAHLKIQFERANDLYLGLLFDLIIVDKETKSYPSAPLSVRTCLKTRS